MPIFLKKKESKEKALKESNKIWRKAKIFEGKQIFLKGSKKNTGKQKNIWRKAKKYLKESKKYLKESNKKFLKESKNIWGKVKKNCRKAKNLWRKAKLFEGKQSHF